MAPAAPAHAAGYTDPVYAACYVFTAGGDHTAIALPPHKTTNQVLASLYLESKLHDTLARPNGYYAARCSSHGTLEAAEAWYRASGYNMVRRAEWPKEIWPENAGAPGSQIACLNSHESGVYVTRAFPSTTAYYFQQLEADAVTRWGSSRWVDCKSGRTAEEAEQAVRRAYNVVPKPWPLPWGEGKAATPAPKPRPQPPAKPAAQAASLTVKTDTGAKDAARAWDEQVKKTLAAEAQKKVETAAKAAQADAKHKAEIEAFFAERRRQGSAQ